MIAKSTKRVLDKAVAGERLTSEEGLALLESHELAAIGSAAASAALPILSAWSASK